MFQTKRFPTHFSFISRPRLYGVFEQPEQVSVLRDAVDALEVPFEQLTVLEGEPGLRQLDSSGTHGGLFTRLVRFTQGMTDEHHEIRKYRQALEQGRLVVLVNMKHDNAHTKEQLRLAFKQAGASSIDYYGNFVNEQLTH